MPFLATLKQTTNYTYTFKNGDNNASASGLVFLKVNKANKVSTADPVFIKGVNPVNYDDQPGQNIDGVVILAAPSYDGANAEGKITLTVTNKDTGVNVVPAQTFTGDQQFSFEVVP